MLLGAGFKLENIKEYRYFDAANKALDFSGMTDDLEVEAFLSSILFKSSFILFSFIFCCWCQQRIIRKVICCSKCTKDHYLCCKCNMS